MNRTARRMSIHIYPDSIQIEAEENGKKSFKNTTLEAIQEVLTRGERTETPLLPSQWGTQKYIRVNNREMYVISTPPHVRSVYYDMRAETGDDEIKEFVVPLPGFLWIFIVDVNPSNDTRKYVHGMVYAVKNPIIGLNDKLFWFPFSNVDNRWMCWGDDRNYPELGTSKSIMTVPDRFLTNPFNHHLDHSKFEEFQDEHNGVTIRRFKTIHLFQYLDREYKAAQEKGETFEFPLKVLREQTRLGDAIEYFTREFLS